MAPSKLDMIPYELTRIDDLLDVCFIRDHSNDKPYLVLSGNLEDELKNHIKENIFNMCLKLNRK